MRDIGKQRCLLRKPEITRFLNRNNIAWPSPPSVSLLPLPVVLMWRSGLPSVKLRIPATGGIAVAEADGKGALTHSSSDKAHTHTQETQRLATMRVKEHPARLSRNGCMLCSYHFFSRWREVGAVVQPRSPIPLPTTKVCVPV